MKTLSYLPFLFIFWVLCSCTSQSPTILTISSEGIKDSVILYFPPDKASPDSLLIYHDHSLKLDLPIKKISAVRLLYAGQYVRLYVEPGKEYKIDFTLKDNETVQFYINDKALQQYYSLDKERDIYKYEWIKDYSVAPYDTVGTKMKTNIDELIARDKEYIDSSDMSPELREVLYNDTEIYWLTALSKIIRNNYIRYYYENIPVYPDYTELWKSIYEEYPLNSLYSEDNRVYDYSQIYLQYNLYLNGKSREFETISDYWDYQYGVLYDELTNNDIKERILALTLYMDCLNNKTYNKALIHHINKFIEEFPQTPDREYFKNYIADLEEYYRIIEGDFSNDVKFVDNYDEITSLKEAFAPFKGKPIFVDFWFSTCGPCIQEFAHTAMLKKFLKENQIEFLYISIDSDRMEENWKNAIKRYNLEGHHIRTTQKLHIDMDETYGIRFFPTYMIVNVDGEIIVNGAKYPSEGQALIDQILESLNIQH